MTARHTVGMVGLGYVGLSTAACLVSKGIRVIGLDVDRVRVSQLAKGVVPIHEEGVEPLLRRALLAGIVSFHDSYEAIEECDVVFLTVGTPGLPDGAIDTGYVESAARAVGARLKNMEGYPVIVVKSTVTPSTTRTKVLPTLEEASGLKCGRDFGLATNPEFLREGKAVWDMMHPDAIVIGRVDQRSVSVLKSLYKTVYRRMPPLLVTDSVNAEFVKYAVNSIRAVQLSFINTLANMCSRIEGARIDEVAKGLVLVSHLDKRYSRAGLGYGGSCLPKDTNALISLARSLGVEETLLDSAVRVNRGQANQAIAMAKDIIGPIRGKHVAVLGLTFKAGTDDVRESVGFRLVHSLAKAGAEVRAYDPGFKPAKNRDLPARLFNDAKSCLKGADCCIITNEWDEFKRLSPRIFKGLMKSPAVVDGRGLFNVEEFRKAGVNLHQIGVGPSSHTPLRRR